MEQFAPFLEPVLGDTWCIVTPFCRMPVYMPDRNNAILIDSGLGYHKAGILALLDQEGIRVTSLLTSHFHRDHVGNHARIKSHFGCTVYMTPFAAALCGDPNNVRGTGYESPLLTKARGGSICCPADKLFSPENGTLEVQGAQFDVVSLPGHCQEQVGFITPDGAAYLSDTILSAPIVDALRIPYCTDCTMDLQAKESLLKLQAKAYILAHNSTEQEIAGLVQKNLDNMYRKLSMVEQLADTWMTMETLAAKVMAHTGAELDNTGKVLGMQRNTQVLVNHLIETDRLTHRVRDGYIEYCRVK
jgi:glyoxylase-like metal-dependent hydrolase (beta-lactamase superfamily II)